MPPPVSGGGRIYDGHFGGKRNYFYFAKTLSPFYSLYV